MSSICRLRIFWWGKSKISDLTNDFLENTSFKLAVGLSFQIQTSPVNVWDMQFSRKAQLLKGLMIFTAIYVSKGKPIVMILCWLMLNPVKSKEGFFKLQMSYKACK